MGAAVRTPELQSLVRDADQIESLVLVMSEAGLCTSENSGCLDQVLSGLDTGRQAIAAGKATEARAALLAARVRFDGVIKSRRWGWRFVFVHRGLLFLYLVACLAVLLNVASGYLSGVADEFWGVPVSALGMGAFGAILRALYWLYRQVARRIFRAQFALAHIAAPMIGLLFGLFTYLLVKGGLLVLQEGQSGDLETSTGVLALCFVAGFSWEWILNWVASFRGASAQQSGAGAGGNDGAGGGVEGNGDENGDADGDGAGDGAGDGEGDGEDGKGDGDTAAGAAAATAPAPPEVPGEGTDSGETTGEGRGVSPSREEDAV